MRGTCYDAGCLTEILKIQGFAEVEFLTFPVASNGGLHSFVLARKPAGDGSRACARANALINSDGETLFTLPLG